MITAVKRCLQCDRPRAWCQHGPRSRDDLEGADPVLVKRIRELERKIASLYVQIPETARTLRARRGTPALLRLARVKQILTSRPSTIYELSSEIGCSVRTVHRYLAQLEAVGEPLTSDHDADNPHQQRYSILGRRESLDKAALKHELVELIQLLLPGVKIE